MQRVLSQDDMENEAEKHSVHKSNRNVEIHDVGTVDKRGFEDVQIMTNGVSLGEVLESVSQ